MMKRIVAVLFLLTLLLVAAAVVAPGFIDWNKHKDILISRLEDALDRDIEVAGDVSFRILPNPQILMQDVSIAAVKGAKNPHLLTLKRMEGKVRLKPLLEGRLEVESFHLTAPELTLEVLEDGQISWGVKKADGGSAFTAVELQNVSVTDGKIRYLRHDSGADIVLDHLNFSLKADRLQGPYVVKGDLRYHDTPVNLELTSGIRNNTGLYPLTVLFQPVDVLPQIRFDGLLGLTSGLVLDGDVEIDGGSIGSLLGDDFAKTAGFMQQAAHIKAALSFKNQKLDLTIAEGAWNGKGKLQGTVSAVLGGVEKPRVTADLSGTTLLLSDKAGGYMPVPAGYDIDAKLKFFDVTWQGARFPGLTLDVKTQNDEWLVGESRLDLHAKGGVQFSGTVTPKQEMATWNIVLNAPDIAAAFAHVPTGSAPLLSALADKSLNLPLVLKGNLDQRKGRISLYNFTASSGADHAVSGVLNLRQDMVEARLTVSKLTLSAFPPAVRAAFMQALLKQTADIELSADQIVFDKTVLENIKLRAAGDGQGLTINALEGMSGAEQEQSFELKGRLTAWPVGQGDFDFTYRLTTADAAGWAEMLGAPMPSPMQNARLFDLMGTWKQDQVAETLTAVGNYQGGSIETLTAVKPRSGDNAAWKSDVKNMHLPQNILFRTFGLPHDRLLLPAGALTFNGVVNGGHIKGLVENGKRRTEVDIRLAADGSSAAEVAADTVDLDPWFADAPVVQADTEMSLRAKKLRWRDMAVDKASGDFVLKPASFEARKLTGLLWGGQLDVSATASRADKKWQGRATGTVKDADLGPLLGMTGLKGLAVGRGDIAFDLEGIGGTKGLREAKGTLSLTIDSLTLDAFDPAALARFIRTQESMPPDLAVRLHKVMRDNGSASFSDVAMELKIADNKVEIVNLTLGNADADMQVRGSFDLAAESYDVTAETVLKNLPDVGSLSIRRKGAAEGAPDYAFDTAGIRAWIEQRIAPPPVVEDMPVITEELHAMPDVPATDVEAEPLDNMPPVDEDDILPPADDSVEVERLPPPELPQEEVPETDADTRDALQGILDRLNDTPPGETVEGEAAEEDILPPE